MMPQPLDPVVIDAARSAAAAGDWTRVSALLGDVQGLEAHSDGALLLAEAWLRLGQPEKARVWLDVVVGVSAARADRPPLRRATNMLGAAAFEMGALDEAEGAWDRALAFAHADADGLLVARATNNLGILANIRGQRDRALSLYRVAVPAYQQLGHSAGIAECYHNMAISYRDASALDDADEYERRAVEFATAVGNTRLVALARLGQAEIAYRRGDTALAGAAAQRVAHEFARLAEPHREADAWRLAGLARLEGGDAAGAKADVERAVRLAQQHGPALVEAESWRALAEVQRRLGERASAAQSATQALELFERLGAKDEAAAMRPLIEEPL